MITISLSLSMLYRYVLGKTDILYCIHICMGVPFVIAELNSFVRILSSGIFYIKQM